MASAISPANLVPAHRTAEPTPSRIVGDGAGFARALGGAQRREPVQLVAPVRTRLDSAQASEALESAWKSVLGDAPSPSSVRILTAQWAHETGNGASMFNYNFGGIKGSGPGGLSVAQRTREGWGSSERTITDRFRAYTTPQEGAADYVRLLSARYPKAIEAARASDPAGFVRALKGGGYFTGNEAEYTRSVVALAGIDPVAGSGSPLPVLDAQRAPSGAHYASAAPGMLPSTPLVDALALADEISRAALRIAAGSGSEREG